MFPSVFNLRMTTPLIHPIKNWLHTNIPKLIYIRTIIWHQPLIHDPLQEVQVMPLNGPPPQETDWDWQMSHHSPRRYIQFWKHIYPQCPKIYIPNIWPHCSPQTSTPMYKKSRIGLTNFPLLSYSSKRSRMHNYLSVRKIHCSLPTKCCNFPRHASLL